MRQFAIIFTILFAVVGLTGSAYAADKTSSIEFEQKSHDFGSIDELGGKVSCEFAFTNIGKAPLVIISATAGCGCTTPEIPEQPIAPGQSGVIKVTYSPLHRPGEFSKSVTVRTNDPKNKKVILRITGVVVPAAE